MFPTVSDWILFYLKALIYSSFWGGSNEQFLASWIFPPPAIFTLYIQCLEISHKLHVLVSLGFTQNRWQVLVYYGSIILQMLFSCAGDSLKWWLYLMMQNCDVPSQALQALKIFRGCFWIMGPECSFIMTGSFMAGSWRWLKEVGLLWFWIHFASEITSPLPPLSLRVAINMRRNYRNPVIPYRNLMWLLVAFLTEGQECNSWTLDLLNQLCTFMWNY